MSPEFFARHRAKLAYRRISYFVLNGWLNLEDVGGLISSLSGTKPADEDEALSKLAIRVAAGWMAQPHVRHRSSPGNILNGMFDTLVKLGICTEDRREEFFEGVITAAQSRVSKV
jgi:hypothetical protein